MANAEAIDWKDIRTYLELFMKIAAVGLPPSPGDKERFRQWLQRALPQIASLTDLTDTDVDDKAIQYLIITVDQELTWDALHALIMSFYQDSEPDEDLLVRCIANDRQPKPLLHGPPKGSEKYEEEIQKTLKLCPATSFGDEKTKIDPAVIMMIIKLILEIIEKFRK